MNQIVHCTPSNSFTVPCTFCGALGTCDVPQLPSCVDWAGCTHIHIVTYIQCGAPPQAYKIKTGGWGGGLPIGQLTWLFAKSRPVGSGLTFCNSSLIELMTLSIIKDFLVCLFLEQMSLQSLKIWAHCSMLQILGFLLK